MWLTSLRARMATVLFALVLLLPILGMPLQSVEELETFHNRRLSSWPDSGGISTDPPGFFAKARAWVADRVFPIGRASQARRLIQFHLLQTAPQTNFALGRGGLIFLMGGSEQHPYELIESICFGAHYEGTAAALQKALVQLAHFGERRRIAVDVVVIPTLLTLYADRLPSSVPERYRRACAERSPLLSIAPPPGVHFVFPFLSLWEARTDEALFPKGNWHPLGLSLTLSRDAYVAALGVAPPAHERLELVNGNAELMRGLMVRRPEYHVINDRVTFDEPRDQVFRAAIASLFSEPINTYVYSNSEPRLPESVLMLSDSYGIGASAIFAGTFSRLMQVTKSGLDASKFTELIDRTDRVNKLDRLILLVNEGAIGQIATWATGL